jgi:hypothetical protein
MRTLRREVEVGRAGVASAERVRGDADSVSVHVRAVGAAKRDGAAQHTLCSYSFGIHSNSSRTEIRICLASMFISFLFVCFLLFFIYFIFFVFSSLLFVPYIFSFGFFSLIGKG